MKEDITKVGFSLQGIKAEQFAVFEENYTNKKEATLSTELQFKLDQTNKKIGVFLGFEFLQSKKVFLKIQVSCHFGIEDESWRSFIQHGNTKIIVPKIFLGHLVMITTGTTRGVLFAKTESTQFSKFIVPMLNIAELIMDDASFDMVVE